MRGLIGFAVVAALAGCGSGEELSTSGLSSSSISAVQAKSIVSSDSASPDCTPTDASPVIRVGPGPDRQYKTISAAAQAAVDGSTILIDAATYLNDTAVWRQSNLKICGVLGPQGERPVLDADRRIANGKGLFVIQGANVTVANLEFRNAKVSSRNGAGIRMEGLKLDVDNAVFRANETAILATPASTQAQLDIFRSQFIENGFKSSNGQAHSIYVGEMARFTIRSSYITGTQIGHLLKSRAYETQVLYNRITGESSTNSYEVDLPNGGLAYLIGNLIEQGARSQNKTVIAYGAEGLPTHYPRPHQLYMSHNTLVNRLTGGCTWLYVPAAGTQLVKLINSITYTVTVTDLSDRDIESKDCVYNVATGVQFFKQRERAVAEDFVHAATYNFHLTSNLVRSPACDPGSAGCHPQLISGAAHAGGDQLGVFPSLAPTHEYQHSAGNASLSSPAPDSPDTTPYDYGAFQSAH